MSNVIDGLTKALSRAWACPVAIKDLRQLTGGASSETWCFTAAAGGRCDTLILRRSTKDDVFAGALSKAQEVQVLSAAHQCGVPVPEVVVQLGPDDGLGEGYVMSCVTGETLPPKILSDPSLEKAREELSGQCGAVLAAIHAVSPEMVDSLPRLATVELLERYHRIYREYDEKLPVFDLAFAWLDEHKPESRRSTLVHGDFRNGNLMVDKDGLRAVLDWELAYVGDPMADLGWLCVNSWRFGRREWPVGGFGRREELYHAYEQGSGVAVDAAAVFFWELFGVLKWGIICLHQCERHRSGREPSVELAAIGRRVSECELDIVDMLQRRGADGHT